MRPWLNLQRRRAESSVPPTSSPTAPSERIVVVGAGVSGLVAARTLHAAGREVLVLERASVVGGRVRGEWLGPTPVDAGASHIWSFYARTRSWLRHLGLLHELRPAGGGGELRVRASDIPGLMGSAIDVARCWRRLDPSRPELAAGIDSASIADYASRHLSATFTAAALRPAFEWNAFCGLDQLSQVLLLQSGRLFLGARPSVLAGGLQRFPHLLAAGLDIRLGASQEVVAIGQSEHGVAVSTAGGELLYGGAAVVATTPAEAARIVDLRRDLAAFLRAVEHSQVLRAWWELAAPVGSGTAGSLRWAPGSVAVSRLAGERLRVALVVYGDQLTEIADGSLPEAISAIGADLVPELGDWPITHHNLHRWDRGVTIFAPGHFRQLAQLCPGSPSGRVALAGDYLVSPTVEGAVVSGERAAVAVMRLPILGA